MSKPYINLPACFLILCLGLFQNLALGQEKIEMGEKFHIDSRVLGEEREIWIGLPKSYHDTVYAKKGYPVCYFFDGDSHFENFVAQRNWLTRNLYSAMPEIILVGIVQKDRTKELTPSAMETPEEWKRANFSTSGGNVAFMQFIEEELKPYINKEYRTNGHEILSGHSFGGLAVVNAFLKHPESYNAYIAIDPSLWWDDKKLLNSLTNTWYDPKYDGKTLFLAKANDSGSGDDHHNAILEFHSRLESLDEGKKLYWKYRFYEPEDHGSVVVPAVYDAMRFIFEGYQMPVKEAMKTPSVLDGHFDAISSKLGYRVLPDEKLLDELAKVCVRQGLIAQAEDLLERNLKNHPKSGHAKTVYESFVKEHKTKSVEK